VILRAALRIGLTQTVHPSSLRIQGPGPVAQEKSNREDHNYDREQLKHVRTSVVQRHSFAAPRPKFDIVEN
jgi:hypothetical protein